MCVLIPLAKNLSRFDEWVNGKIIKEWTWMVNCDALNNGIVCGSSASDDTTDGMTLLIDMEKNCKLLKINLHLCHIPENLKSSIVGGYRHFS